LPGLTILALSVAAWTAAIGETRPAVIGWVATRKGMKPVKALLESRDPQWTTTNRLVLRRDGLDIIGVAIKPGSCQDKVWTLELLAGMPDDVEFNDEVVEFIPVPPMGKVAWPSTGTEWWYKLKLVNGDTVRLIKPQGESELPPGEWRYTWSSLWEHSDSPRHRGNVKVAPGETVYPPSPPRIDRPQALFTLRRMFVCKETNTQESLAELQRLLKNDSGAILDLMRQNNIDHDQQYLHECIKQHEPDAWKAYEALFLGAKTAKWPIVKVSVNARQCRRAEVRRVMIGSRQIYPEGSGEHLVLRSRMAELRVDWQMPDKEIFQTNIAEQPVADRVELKVPDMDASRDVPQVGALNDARRALANRDVAAFTNAMMRIGDYVFQREDNQKKLQDVRDVRVFAVTLQLDEPGRMESVEATFTVDRDDRALIVNGLPVTRFVWSEGIYKVDARLPDFLPLAKTFELQSKPGDAWVTPVVWTLALADFKKTDALKQLDQFELLPRNAEAIRAFLKTHGENRFESTGNRRRLKQLHDWLNQEDLRVRLIREMVPWRDGHAGRLKREIETARDNRWDITNVVVDIVEAWCSDFPLAERTQRLTGLQGMVALLPSPARNRLEMARATNVVQVEWLGDGKSLKPVWKPNIMVSSDVNQRVWRYVSAPFGVSEKCLLRIEPAPFYKPVELELPLQPGQTTPVRLPLVFHDSVIMRSVKETVGCEVRVLHRGDERILRPGETWIREMKDMNELAMLRISRRDYKDGEKQVNLRAGVTCVVDVADVKLEPGPALVVLQRAKAEQVDIRANRLPAHWVKPSDVSLDALATVGKLDDPVNETSKREISDWWNNLKRESGLVDGVRGFSWQLSDPTIGHLRFRRDDAKAWVRRYAGLTLAQEQPATSAHRTWAASGTSNMIPNFVTGTPDWNAYHDSCGSILEELCSEKEPNVFDMRLALFALATFWMDVSKPGQADYIYKVAQAVREETSASRNDEVRAKTRVMSWRRNRERYMTVWNRYKQRGGQLEAVLPAHQAGWNGDMVPVWEWARRWLSEQPTERENELLDALEQASRYPSWKE
jgi:hypothetical protein